MFRKLVHGFAVAVAATFIGGAASAAFPEKPITIIVPYSLGGPADKTARDLAVALASILKTRVDVENVAGVSGTLGAQKVLQSKADGYTLLFSHIGFSTSYALYRKGTDALDDFEYLGVTSELPMVLVGRPDLEAKDMRDLVRLIAEKRGMVRIANAGTGSASHICSIMLEQHLKQRLIDIPYKGTAPAMTDLLAGHVDLLCDQSSTAMPQVIAGRAKAFAVTTAERFKAPPPMQSVPTLEEAGLKGFNLNVWQGMYAPRGTPKDVLETLNKALRSALKDPAFRRRQLDDGVHVVEDERLSADGHKRLVRAEAMKWTAIIKSGALATR